MAKALICVVFATLLVAGLAAETGRSLKQQQVPFDCKGLEEFKKVSGPCNLLCSCAASLLEANKDSEKARCLKQCDECIKSPCSGGLPKPCQEAQGNRQVNQCITTYLKSRSG